MPFGFVFFFLKKTLQQDEFVINVSPPEVTKSQVADWSLCKGNSRPAAWRSASPRSELRFSDAVGEDALLRDVPNVFLSRSLSLLFLRCYSIRVHSGAPSVRGTNDVVGGGGTFPVALWCTFALFFFSTRHCPAVTSDCPHVIVWLHHHLFPFWLWLDLLADRKLAVIFDSYLYPLMLQENREHVHKESRALKSPVPAPACHTDTPPSVVHHTEAPGNALKPNFSKHKIVYCLFWNLKCDEWKALSKSPDAFKGYFFLNWVQLEVQSITTVIL